MRTPAALRRCAAPLASRSFRIYLSAQLPSVACSWAQVVALAWVVVHLHPYALGWIVALQFLPSLLLGPYCGVIADRHDRRRVLICAEAGLGLVAVCYAAAELSGRLSLPLVATLACSWGVCNAFDTPARRALVPGLVPESAAAGAAGLTGSAMVLGMAIGTALGGVAVASIGAGAVFAANAASFAADVVALTLIRPRPVPPLPPAPGQALDGLRYLWRTRSLRSPLLTVVVVATFCFQVPVSVPLLASQRFDADPRLVGTLLTATMVGALVGTGLVAGSRHAGASALTWSAAVISGGLVVVGSARTPAAAVAGLACVGLGWSWLVGTVTVVLQQAPPELLGRVMALAGAALLSGSTVGGPLAATIAAAGGPGAPFVLGGAVAAIVTVVHLRSIRAARLTR